MANVVTAELEEGTSVAVVAQETGVTVVVHLAIEDLAVIQDVALIKVTKDWIEKRF